MDSTERDLDPVAVREPPLQEEPRRLVALGTRGLGDGSEVRDWQVLAAWADGLSDVLTQPAPDFFLEVCIAWCYCPLGQFDPLV